MHRRRELTLLQLVAMSCWLYEVLPVNASDVLYLSDVTRSVAFSANGMIQKQLYGQICVIVLKVQNL